MSLAVPFLVFIATYSNPVDAASERTLELQLSVAVGGSVTLPCSTTADTSVDWRYHFSPLEQPSMVYSNHLVYEGYKDRFNVIRHTPDDYGLTISRAQVDDKGIYTCIEDGGYGKKHTISLMVSVSDSPPAEEPSSGVNIGIVIVLVIVLVAVIAIAVIEAVYIVLVLRRHKDKTDGSRKTPSGPYKDSSRDTAKIAIVDDELPMTPEEEPLMMDTTTSAGSNIPFNESGNMTVATDSALDSSLSDTQNLSATQLSIRRLKPTNTDSNANVSSNVHDADVPAPYTARVDDHSTTVLPVITFKMAAPHGKEIHGVCVVGDKLYVARSPQSEIDIYDRRTMTLVDHLPVTGEGSDYPGCMVFDSGRQLFYISYFRAKTVRRIRLGDGDCKAWPVTGEPDGVAVTSRGVLVTLRNEGKLVEFEPDGKLIREIHLDNGVNKPRHAIPYGVDGFLVCFGFAGERCGVCLVNGTGGLMKTVQSKTEHPLYVDVGKDSSVFVADFNGHKVTMLNKSMEYVMDAIKKGDVHQPFRLCVDEHFENLYVGDYKGGCSAFSISYK